MSLRKSPSNEALTQYVLGELGEDERERVEHQYFTDVSVHERLLALEEELADSYVRGALSEPRHMRVQALFFDSAEDRGRMAFSRALCHWIDERGEKREEVSVVPQGPSLWQRAGAIFAAHTSALQFAFAALALIAIVTALVWWRAAPNLPKPELQAKHAEPRTESQIPQHSSSQLAQSQPSYRHRSGSTAVTPVVAFTLIPGTRDVGSPGNTIAVPAVPATIRLKMDVASIDYATYRATIQPAGAASGPSFLAHRLGDRSSIMYVDVPSSALRSGDYSIELEGIGQNGANEVVAGYSFRVERRR